MAPREFNMKSIDSMGVDTIAIPDCLALYLY
jgi:hypothetical protein